MREINTKILFATVLCLILTSCHYLKDKTVTVTKLEDLGSVNISIVQVAPWKKYVEPLSPKFSVKSADELLDDVLPKTSIVEDKLVEALVGELSLGLAGSTKSTTDNIKSVTESVTDQPDTTTSTSTTETNKESGTATAPEQSIEFDNSSKISSDSGAKGDIANDPFLQRSTATALYQEIQLLNRYVKDAATFTGKTPYLVRFQLQVSPYARTMPYDIYSTIGFFGYCKNQDNNQIDKQTVGDHYKYGCQDHNLKLDKYHDGKINVLPIFVTDNLESSSTNKVVEQIRSLTTALSASKGGIGGGTWVWF